MKPVLLLFALLLASPLAAQDAPSSGPRSITVTGNAERILSADRVRISAALVANLVEVGVPSEKIELGNHSLGREYETGPEGRRISKGFFSQRQFAIELDDASLLELVHGSLAENPEIAVHGTDFSRKDEIEVRKELRKTALEAAKEKAEAMAAVYGQKVGRPLKMSESGGGFTTRNVSSNQVAFLLVDGVGGRVSIDALVEVTFELLD